MQTSQGYIRVTSLALWPFAGSHSENTHPICDILGLWYAVAMAEMSAETGSGQGQLHSLHMGNIFYASNPVFGL